METAPAIIESATSAVAAEIWQLQQLAYQTEAALYGDRSIPPLLETLDQLQAFFAKGRFLKAVCDGRIVGSVRGAMSDETCLVGRLIVHPDYRRRGIGSSLLLAIEAAFPEARRFELFTGQRSAANIRLYERAGYRQFRQESTAGGRTMVFLEKQTPPLPQVGEGS